MANTDELIIAKFQELQKQQTDIRAKSAPLHDQRNALRTQMDPLLAQEANLVTQIKEAEAGLYEVDMQLSKISGLLPNNRRMSEGPNG